MTEKAELQGSPMAPVPSSHEAQETGVAITEFTKASQENASDPSHEAQGTGLAITEFNQGSQKNASVPSQEASGTGAAITEPTKGCQENASDPSHEAQRTGAAITELSKESQENASETQEDHNKRELEKEKEVEEEENFDGVATVVDENVELEKGESSSSGLKDNAGALDGLDDPCGHVPPDLKEYEKKALVELRSKLEESILMNKLWFKAKKENEEEKKALENRGEPSSSMEDARETKEEKAPEEEGKNGNASNGGDSKEDKGKAILESESEEEKRQSNVEHGDADGKLLLMKPTNEERESCREKERESDVDKDISLWGVPLLPSKGDKATNIVLLKFLRARDFRVNDAFQMLRSSLQWRKDNKIDSILEEDLGSDYDSVTYMNGVDRQGHPVCYNVYGVFADDELYNRTFGTGESRERFLRWRLQQMEKEIKDLNLKDGGVSCLLQINDLKNTPGPSRRDLRTATKQAVALLQDNYPEFVARNIFINVPFWYYAFNALLSPFLTQRTKSKFIFTRPARVTETLLKHIAAEQIPVHYGGLKRENDPDFSTEDSAAEVTIRAGSMGTIEIPTAEVGSRLVWDVTVLGWEVNYKEEFVPTDESSYTVIVKKERRIGWEEGSVRNFFKNKEPGTLVISMENGSFKKKRGLYRYKIINHPSATEDDGLRL